MRLSYLAYTFSLAVTYFGIVLLFPVSVAVYYGEYSAILPFLVPSLAAFLLSLTIKKCINNSHKIKSINDIKKSEGLTVVTFSWIFAGIFASIPYLFFGLTPINALFEAIAGITTTGATTLTHFDYPHAMFFWRSLTQWFGGMGIIVLFIAILPQFAIAGRQLFFAEAPGPTEEKFTPRIKSTAASLWKIYAGMTLIEFVALKICGMGSFEAICHSFSSLSGGGFSPNAESISVYPHTVMWVIAFFMFFAGANFNLQYSAWTKLNPFILFKNEEFRVYFGGVLIISLLLAVSLFTNMHYDVVNSFTHSFFNVTSLVSSSGFCSVDYAQWDYISKVLLFVIILFGSCASSAGGGLKVMRWMLVFKIMKSEMVKILHPKAVYNIKIGNKTVPKEILYQTIMFVSFYFGLMAISAFITGITEQNTTVAIIGSVSSIGNLGPGFGNIIGPMGNFDSLQPVTKFVFMIDMLAGRLELIPFLVLFQKDLWIFKSE